MKIKILSLVLSSLLITISCKIQEKKISTSSESKQSTEITTSLAENYFVKNTFQNQELVTKKISTQKEFDEIFGMASFMGKNGTPTKIDFNKEFVLAVINPITDMETKIETTKLEKVDNKLKYHYKLNTSKKIDFKLQPFLITIVDNKNKEEVEFIKD